MTTINKSETKYNYINIYFLAINHLLAVFGIYYIFHCNSYKTLIYNFVNYNLCSLAITGGHHRLWAHKSYEATLIVKLFYLYYSFMAFETSIYDWCVVHRVHHKYSDTDIDPHDSNKGLFFSHIGWILQEFSEETKQALKNTDTTDLLNDPVVMFSDYTYPYFHFIVCFFIPTLIPMYYYNELFFTAFTINSLRLILSLHTTWCVNSLAHKYGDKPYKDINSRENLFVSIIAHGEGWHNWHHTYPYDYKASELGPFQQLNITSLFIDICHIFGLTSNLKTANIYWDRKKLRELIS